MCNIFRDIFVRYVQGHKFSDVFKEAAEKIDAREEHFSCIAIDEARFFGWLTNNSMARQYYSKLMSENEDHEIDVGQFNNDWSNARELRVLALLMAAEVAESEGL